MVDTNSNSIYVTLVSTASSDVYTGANKNTSAHFINRLKNPLRLEGNNDGGAGTTGSADWAVALLDIQLPTTASVIIREPLSILHMEATEFKNPPASGPQPPPQVRRDILNPDGLTLMHEAYVSEFTKTWPPLPVPDIEDEEEVRRRFAEMGLPPPPPRRGNPRTIYYRRWILQIPPTTFNSTAAIIEFINTAMAKAFPEDVKKGWKFMEYDDVHKRVFYQNPAHLTRLVFHDNEITQMLGLADQVKHLYKAYDNGEPLKPRKVYARQPVSTRENYSYFVYSDCVDVCNIGDGVGQLLRQIDAKDTGALTSFALPHYRPVSRHSIESIEIDIRNLAGNNPKFLHSCTTCTLHFRKRI